MRLRWFLSLGAATAGADWLLSGGYRVHWAAVGCDVLDAGGERPTGTQPSIRIRYGLVLTQAARPTPSIDPSGFRRPLRPVRLIRSYEPSTPLLSWLRPFTRQYAVCRVLSKAMDENVNWDLVTPEDDPPAPPMNGGRSSMEGVESTTATAAADPLQRAIESAVVSTQRMDAPVGRVLGDEHDGDTPPPTSRPSTPPAGTPVPKYAASRWKHRSVVTNWLGTSTVPPCDDELDQLIAVDDCPMAAADTNDNAAGGAGSSGLLWAATLWRAVPSAMRDAYEYHESILDWRFSVPRVDALGRFQPVVLQDITVFQGCLAGYVRAVWVPPVVWGGPTTTGRRWEDVLATTSLPGPVNGPQGSVFSNRFTGTAVIL